MRRYPGSYFSALTVSSNIKSASLGTTKQQIDNKYALELLLLNYISCCCGKFSKVNDTTRWKCISIKTMPGLLPALF